MNDIELPSPEQARTLTDRIKIAVEGTWQLIREAYTSRTWAVLGYDTWDAYCTAEFGETRLRLPREERQGVVASLRESGMSYPAIAAATGISVGTAHAAAQAFRTESLGGHTRGTDGKSYAATRPSTPDLLAGDDWQQPEGPGFEAAVTPPPSPARAPDRQPRMDVARTVLSALTELRQTSESLQSLTAAHLARQDEETRRIWAARLNTELEALHGFHDALIKGNSQ